MPIGGAWTFMAIGELSITFVLHVVQMRFPLSHAIGDSHATSVTFLSRGHLSTIVSSLDLRW
jgi:hypothetical protein